MDALLETFCKRYLRVTNPNVPLLVPELRRPSGILVFQDRVYDEEQMYETKDGILVAVDIFQHKVNVSANVRFLKADNTPGYERLQNVSLVTVIDFVAMCSGHGSWRARCGILTGYLTGLDGGTCEYADKWDPKKQKRFTDKFLQKNRKNSILSGLIELFLQQKKMAALL